MRTKFDPPKLNAERSLVEAHHLSPLRDGISWMAKARVNRAVAKHRERYLTELELTATRNTAAVIEAEADAVARKVIGGIKSHDFRVTAMLVEDVRAEAGVHQGRQATLGVVEKIESMQRRRDLYQDLEERRRQNLVSESEAEVMRADADSVLEREHAATNARMEKAVAVIDAAFDDFINSQKR